MIIILLALFTSNTVFAELAIPDYCRFSKQDIAAPPPSKNLLVKLTQSTRDAAGRSAMRFLETAHHRSDLERRMILRNPSYALPYAQSNLFAPLMRGMMCKTMPSDMNILGGLNHFLISALLTAQIGRDDGCKLIMSHEHGEFDSVNSYMDVKNNLLGNVAGVTHRQEILACMTLMSELATQRFHQENQSGIFDIVDKLDVRGGHMAFPPFKDMSAQSIATRFEVQAPKFDNVKNTDSCNKLKQIIKDTYMPRLYYTEATTCDSEMSGTPTLTTWESDRKAFNNYQQNMREVLQ